MWWVLLGGSCRGGSPGAPVGSGRDQDCTAVARVVPGKAGVNWPMLGPRAHVREGAPMTVTVCGVGGSMCGLSPPYSPLKERPFRCGRPWGCSRW